MANEKQQLQAWLESFPPRWALLPFPTPGLTREAWQAVLFQEIIADLEHLKDVFGYEAVYFGIGCVVFPEAIPPGVE